MNSIRYSSLAPAFAALMAAPLLAQEPSGEEVLRSPAFVKAPVGPGAVIHNDADQRLGTVSDHVLEPRSGKVLFAAVQAGNEPEARLVPYGRFAWNVDERRLELRMTADELGSMPVYEKDKMLAAGEPGLERSNEAREAAATHKKKLNLTSTDVLHSMILTGEETFATVDALVLEPNHGTIAFLLAKGAGSEVDPYVIPWKAMKWETTEEGKGRFVLTTPTSALEEAPTLTQADTSLLERKETLAEIYDFYGVAAPPSRP